MGEIFASAPPALIVIHPGSVAAPLVAAVVAGSAALDDAESLRFEGDQTHPTTPDDGRAESFGSKDGEELAEAVLFAPGPDDAMAEPLTAEGHDPAAEPTDGGAPWAGDWGGFKEDAAHAGEGAVDLAEPDQDEGLENVDFAAITGRAAPGSALAAGLGGADIAVEPPREKKRKREANMFVRFIGMGVAALLALACVLGFATWKGMDVLPAWLHFSFLKPSPRADSPKPSGQPNTPASGQTPADNAKPAANPNASDAGSQPEREQGKTAIVETKPGATVNESTTSDSGKGTEAAMIGPAKEGAQPAAPLAAKPAAEPGPFDSDAVTKPAVGPPLGSDLPPPGKPGAAMPDSELLGSPPIAAKPDTAASRETVSAPTPSQPEAAKPDAAPRDGDTASAPAASKPETMPKSDAEPSAPPAAAAVKEQASMADAKPEDKPADRETAGLPVPGKPETMPKPDAEPSAPPAAAPVKEETNTTEAKPDLPVPAVPEKPAKPEKLGPDTNSSTVPDLKTETPVIGPQPTPAVKPDEAPGAMPGVKPDEKPEVVPAVKPVAGIVPLQSPSFAAADLESSLKAVSGATTVDANSYTDWCKLAEVVTYAKEGSESQKQTLRTLTEKVASDPQAASAIAASAKKLLDDKASKGGIVLMGTVSGLASKNGLNGTVIRVEGLEKPVRVFSGRPLDVKQDQKVIVLGALVAEPAKNLPGYTGTQSVVVWADFATVIP